MRFFLFFLLCSVVTISATPVVLYSNNFSSSAAGWSSTTISSSNGESFLASASNGFGAGTVNYSLSNMLQHDSVTVSFDLYIIQTWDGNGPDGGGEDRWNFFADGTTMLSTTFANYVNLNKQGYGGPGLTNGAYAPRTGQYEAGHLGFGTGSSGDATYRLSFTFAHASSTLALAFQSLQNQAVGDEGWGLDNVTITANVIPEPGTIFLSLLSMMLFIAYRIRK